MIMIGAALDRRALTEMLVDKIIIRARSTRTAGTTSSAPSHTKILSKRLSASRRCTGPGSRSSPGSERVADYLRPPSRGGRDRL
jgi:hypothetical protein